jgi:hypothetical protein
MCGVVKPLRVECGPIHCRLPAPPPDSVPTAPTGQERLCNPSGLSPREGVPGPGNPPIPEVHMTGHFTSDETRPSQQLATKRGIPT